MAQNYHLIYPIGIILNDGKVLNIIDKNLSYSKNIVDNIKITTKYGISNNTNVIKSFDNYKFTETKDGKHIYNLIGYGYDVQQLIFDKNDKYLISLLENNSIEIKNDEKGNIVDKTAYLKAVENDASKYTIANNNNNNYDSRPSTTDSTDSTDSTASINTDSITSINTDSTDSTGSTGSKGSTIKQKPIPQKPIPQKPIPQKHIPQKHIPQKHIPQNNNDSRIKELKNLIISNINFENSCKGDNLGPNIKNQCDQLQQYKNELKILQNKAGKTRKTRKTRKTKKNQKKSRKTRK